MPIPSEYLCASEDFQRFMADARATAELDSIHQTYTMVDAVFAVFRRRLTLHETLEFARILPPVLRAIFIAGWNPDDALRPFASPEAMLREVRAFGDGHNLSPDTAISDVAAALRRHIDKDAFTRALHKLPPDAERFWTP